MQEKIDQAFEQLITASHLAIVELRKRDMGEAVDERIEHLGALSLLRQLVSEALAAKTPPWTKGDTVWHHEYGLVELGDRTVHGTWLVGDDGAEVSDHELRWPDDQAQRADEHRALSGVLDDFGVPPGNLVDRVQTMREREAGEVNAALLEACKAMLGEPGPYATRRTLAEAAVIRAKASAAIEAASAQELAAVVR